MDNASSHQELDLANVKIVKLPANCTSILQPMDQGIIQAMKLKFDKQQSQCIISKMENNPLSGTDLLKEVTVLDTIYWINRAWNDITSTCIKRVLKSVGSTKWVNSHLKMTATMKKMTTSTSHSKHVHRRSTVAAFRTLSTRR